DGGRGDGAFSLPARARRSGAQDADRARTFFDGAVLNPGPTGIHTVTGSTFCGGTASPRFSTRLRSPRVCAVEPALYCVEQSSLPSCRPRSRPSRRTGCPTTAFGPAAIPAQSRRHRHRRRSRVSLLRRGRRSVVGPRAVGSVSRQIEMKVVLVESVV